MPRNVFNNLISSNVLSQETLYERYICQVITTLSQLEDLADGVSDIGKCGVSPLITKQHLCTSNTSEDISIPPSDSNMDCLMEEGGFLISYLSQMNGSLLMCITWWIFSPLVGAVRF